MAEKVSIIVPVFNAEKYLEECINSLVNQTYKNLEIIIVDDGSTDGSAAICDMWGNKDSRINVLHKRNEGLSSARNAGLEAVTGDYVAFVDSDDWIALDMYEFLLMNLYENDASISICSDYKVYGSKIRRPEKKEHIFLKMNSSEAFKKINEIGYFGVGVWDKICKIELFDDLRFPIGHTNEDYWVTYTLMDRADVIVYDSTPKYFYRQQKSSITHSHTIDFNSIKSTKKMLKLVANKYPTALPYAKMGHVMALMGTYDSLLNDNAEKHPEWVRIKSETQHFIREHYQSIKKYTSPPFQRRIQMILIGWLPQIYPQFLVVFKKWKNRGIR